MSGLIDLNCDAIKRLQRGLREADNRLYEAFHILESIGQRDIASKIVEIRKTLGGRKR